MLSYNGIFGIFITSDCSHTFQRYHLLIVTFFVEWGVMEKIVIIGSPGAGKSTLARDLGRILHINVVHLDRIFWKPGWEKKPRDIRIEILQEIVRKDQWIIEGTYLGSSEPRLEAADTIIFLDTATLVCLKRILMRHFNQGRIHRDIPDGCHDKLNFIRILKVLVFPFRGRSMLGYELRKYKSKQIIRLGSTKEINDFLARLEPQANEKKKFSKTRSVAGKRQLALARR